ncbi:MAG: gamma-glutamylcyclotransferase family protein [Candidatus Hodarchaeota archaeon]
MVVNVFGYGTFITRYYDKYPIIAEIEGFKRIYHPDPIYPFFFPFVIKRTGAKMRGIMMHEKDDKYLKYWDDYEGYPKFYNRIEIEVKIVSDKHKILGDIELDSMKTWLYVPSKRTESLDLDKLYKKMRREKSDDYQEMMEKDLWMEKLKQESPDILETLPELFLE